MYTAKIINKETINGALRVTVEFSDGVTTVTESCIPQDFDGLKYWVKSRLATFNGAKDIDSQYALNDTIDTTEPVVVPPTPTQAEIDEAEWLKNYQRWVSIKKNLIDTGILTGNETPLVTLLAKIKTNFKPAYLDKI